MNQSNANRILEAWVQLEAALRAALPVCSIQPPTQPLELLSALRINGQIGPREEAEVMSLREIRNRVAHDPDEPSIQETEAYEEKVEGLITLLGTGASPC